MVLTKGTIDSMRAMSAAVNKRGKFEYSVPHILKTFSVSRGSFYKYCGKRGRTNRAESKRGEGTTLFGLTEGMKVAIAEIEEARREGTLEIETEIRDGLKKSEDKLEYHLSELVRLRKAVLSITVD
jgi:hypothetical protein